MQDHALLDDQDLIQAYRLGDDTAVDILYARYWPKVRDLTQRYMRSTGDAEDVAQDIFVKLFVDKKIFNFKGQSQFWSWLFRIVVNACKSKLIRRRRREEIHFENWEKLEEMTAFTHAMEDPETLAIQNEKYELVKKTLEKLKPGYQKGVSAIYFEHRHYAEASRELGISMHTLGVQIMRAKSLLRRLIHAEMDFSAGNPALRPEASMTVLPEAA